MLLEVGSNFHGAPSALGENSDFAIASRCLECLLMPKYTKRAIWSSDISCILLSGLSFFLSSLLYFKMLVEVLWQVTIHPESVLQTDIVSRLGGWWSFSLKECISVKAIIGCFATRADANEGNQNHEISLVSAEAKFIFAG